MPSKVYVFDSLIPSDIGGYLQVQADSSVKAVQVGFLTPSNTAVLTNKSFDANDIGNVLTNVELDNFAASVVVTDTALTGVTNSQLASALAVKTYVDNQLGISNVLTYKGDINLSSNPNFPSGEVGDFYRVSSPGRIGGIIGKELSIEDIFYRIADSSGGSYAVDGANWGYLQGNVGSANILEEGIVRLADASETESKTSSTSAVTPLSLVNFPIKKLFTIGDGSTNVYTLTHNLGTRDIIVSARDTSSHEHVSVQVTCTSTNAVTLTFDASIGLNSIVVTIIG